MQFFYPLEKFIVTQPFGARSSMYASGKHMGIDLRTAGGSVPVYAAADGKVVVAKGTAPFDGYGAHVAIDHGDGYFTVYGHLDEVKCKVGDEVLLGQCIGLSGGNPRDYGAKGKSMLVNGQYTKAGASTAYHLHFEIDRNDVGPRFCIDPTPITKHDPDIHNKYLTQKYLNSPTPQNMQEWQNAAQKWAKENGVSTGERPLDKLTRVELWETLRKFSAAFGLVKKV